jgi:hypothetical protein
MKKKHPIPGFEGLYFVNEYGQIFVHERVSSMPKGGTRIYPAKQLRLHYIRSGYLMAALYKNGKKSEVPVHRIVCTTFHGQPPTDLHQVNHKNGDKKDNTPLNLEWVTASENQKHSYATLNRKPSHTLPVVGIDPKTGNVVKWYQMLKDVEIDGFTPSNVSTVIHGRMKTSGGLIWRAAK